MNKQIIFIKLGGSLVTDKRKAYTFNESIVNQIVEEIVGCLKAQPHLQLVLGNGAGSFAHQSAAKYRLSEGVNQDAGRFGACVTHNDASYLNHLITKIFHKARLPIFSLQPSAFILASNRNTVTMDLSVYRQLIQHHIIPFVYGDVIIDEVLGATVYSTDRIFRELAQQTVQTILAPSLIIHAGNYDGVMDQKGNIVSKITKNNYEEIKKSLYSSDLIDVTGGMEQKVKEMLHLADKGISSIIVNGKKKGIITQAMQGDLSSGTYITTS